MGWDIWRPVFFHFFTVPKKIPITTFLRKTSNWVAHGMKIGDAKNQGMLSRLSIPSSSEVDRPGSYEVEIRHVGDRHESGFLPCQRRHIKQPLCEKWAIRSYPGWRTVMQKIEGYLAWKSTIFEHLPKNSDFFANDIIYLGNLDVSVLLPCQSRYIQLWHGRIWGLSSHIFRSQ